MTLPERADRPRRPWRSSRWARALAASLIALAVSSAALAQRPLELSGTIVNPTGAPGTIAAWGAYLDAGAQSVVGLGDVDASGAFRVELPGDIAPGALGQIDTTGLCMAGNAGVQVSPARFGHLVVFYLLAFEIESPVGAMLASSEEAVGRFTAGSDAEGAEAAEAATNTVANHPDDYLVYFLYVTENVRVEGACVASNGDPVRYALNARPGWNPVLVTREVADGAVRTVLSTVDAVPADASWRSLVD